MYLFMNNRLSIKRNDKYYLMMMEDFYKRFYERCDMCKCREYSDNLIASSRLLQNDFKNIKFKKFRKSPKHNSNLIINFLYNICYDGVKQIHYPVYLINSIIYMFRATTFYHYINNFECITDDNKIAKTTFYTLNTIGIELITYDKPLGIDRLKVLLTYSFQYPNDKPKTLTEYRVSKVVYYETNYLYSAFYHNDNCYLYRIRVEKIYILSNDVLPFKDVCCLMFYHDKLIKHLFNKCNILLELQIQVVNVYKDGDRYVKKFDYNKFKKEQHKHILLNNVLNNEYYIVNQDGINLFDKSLLTDKELNDLFNPVSQEIEPTIKQKINIIDNSDSEDNSDIEEEYIKDVITNEPQYVFSYNKFINFNDYDKNIIETSIYNKLKDNDKMILLFKPYNTINIIKNINKTYTKQKYFNVILFNTDNKTLSNQYHIYLDNTNNITSITEINNLLN